MRVKKVPCLDNTCWCCAKQSRDRLPTTDKEVESVLPSSSPPTSSLRSISVKLTTVSILLFFWTDSQTWSRDLCKNYVCILHILVDTNITFSSDFIMSSRTESETIPPPPPHKNHHFVRVFVTARENGPPFVSQPKMSDKIKIPCSYCCNLSDSDCFLKLHVFFATRSHIILFLNKLILNDTTSQIIYNIYKYTCETCNPQHRFFMNIKIFHFWS